MKVTELAIGIALRRRLTANYSFVLRGYVRHWLGQVWGEFDRVRLPDLVSPKSEKTVRQVAG